MARFPNGRMSSVILASNSSERENPDYRVGFTFASKWGKSHLWSCFDGAPRGKNPCSGSRTSSGGKSHCGVTKMFVGWSVVAFEWDQSHLGAHRPGIECSS